MGALDGLLVIALEQAVAAPVCTVRRADGGARVIKVERDGGETARNYDAAVKGTSAYFAWLNRGKESTVLNLKEAEDFALFKRMLGKADVLVQNLAPGAMGRMGLSDEVLAQEFPRLIAVSIVGYGQDTDYSAMRAYDLLVQAESGICAVTGTPDEPAKIGVSAADIATGSNAHALILEALIARGQTGRGAQIEVAMFDGVADWMAVPLLHHEYGGKPTRRYGIMHASIYPYGSFSCSDGAVMIAVQTNAEYKRLCDVVLREPALFEDPRFASNALRVQNRDAMDAAMMPIMAALTTAEAEARLQDAGIAWGRYTEVADLPGHVALRRQEVVLPGGETAHVPRPAGRAEQRQAPAIPGLGEHTDAVRAEFAG